jgi:hypothetical protein
VPKNNSTFVYGALTVARKASIIAKLGEALHDYEHLRPVGIEIFDCEYASLKLMYAAREYLTAFKKHVLFNIPKRVEKASMRFFRVLKKTFTAKKR